MGLIVMAAMIAATVVIAFYHPWATDEKSGGWHSADEEMRMLLQKREEAGVPVNAEAKDHSSPVANKTKTKETETSNASGPVKKSEDLLPEKGEMSYKSDQSDIPAVSLPTASDPGAPLTKVPLNTATVKQLETLPGIGPSRAQAIADLRAKLGGSFQSVEQLLEVKGIGEKMLEKIRPHLVLEP